MKITVIIQVLLVAVVKDTAALCVDFLPDCFGLLVTPAIVGFHVQCTDIDSYDYDNLDNVQWECNDCL